MENSIDPKKIRNIAVIAHIDHGKTTLVDAILQHSNALTRHQIGHERIMDSNDIERERGITILSKTASLNYKDHYIQIVDTPGHSDFSGEVERILSLVDGCLLVVDAFEGPMAQTRFVVEQALAHDLKPILVVNKMDRDDARPDDVVNEVLELFLHLDAKDHQIDFPVIYASAKQHLSSLEEEMEGALDMSALLDTIVEQVPPPQVDPDGDFRMLVTNIDHDDYVGRLITGKILSGSLKNQDRLIYGSPQREGSWPSAQVTSIFRYVGTEKTKITEAQAGEIVYLAGIGEAQIGDTLQPHTSEPNPLPGVLIQPPTLSMTFSPCDSPFAGLEGKYVTSRQIRDRLFKETQRNVALQVLETDSPEVLEVRGRGELHLSILIENLRREGFELNVSAPKAVFQEIEGKLHEPYEELMVDLPQDYVGSVMERLNERKGIMQTMKQLDHERTRITYEIPARGLIGFRNELLTLSRGFGIMQHLPIGYRPYAGHLSTRRKGSLISSEKGAVTTYALRNLEDRGVFFVQPQAEVYCGMVVGEHTRENDLELNVCKQKQVTNVRSSTQEITQRLQGTREMSLEDALEYIQEDELVEVTPQSIRIRKRFLKASDRVREKKKKQQLEQSRA